MTNAYSRQGGSTAVGYMMSVITSDPMLGCSMRHWTSCTTWHGFACCALRNTARAGRPILECTHRKFEKCTARTVLALQQSENDTSRKKYITVENQLSISSLDQRCDPRLDLWDVCRIRRDPRSKILPHESADTNAHLLHHLGERHGI